MPAQIEMPAMTVAAVEADLESVTTDERRQTVDALDTQARHRNRLIEQLDAGVTAELAAVADRAFARAEHIHPRPQGAGDREQKQPGSEHGRSVGTVALAGKGSAKAT